MHRDFATTAEKSVKERAVLSQQQVASFLAGKPVLELPEGNYVQDVQFLADVQQYIIYYGQVRVYICVFLNKKLGALKYFLFFLLRFLS